MLPGEFYFLIAISAFLEFLVPLSKFISLTCSAVTGLFDHKHSYQNLQWCQQARCVSYGRTGPAPIHGWWTEWGAWSGCTRSCGGGIKTRTRECNNPRYELLFLLFFQFFFLNFQFAYWGLGAKLPVSTSFYLTSYNSFAPSPQYTMFHSTEYIGKMICCQWWQNANSSKTKNMKR